MKWESQTGPAAIAESRPRTVRVQRLDGTVVELLSPEVHADSVSGLVPGSARPGMPLRRLKIPVDSIERVATKRGSSRRIAAAAVGAPVAVVLGVFLMDW